MEFSFGDNEEPEINNKYNIDNGHMKMYDQYKIE